MPSTQLWRLYNREPVWLSAASCLQGERSPRVADGGHPRFEYVAVALPVCIELSLALDLGSDVHNAEILRPRRTTQNCNPIATTPRRNAAI